MRCSASATRARSNGPHREPTMVIFVHDYGSPLHRLRSREGGLQDHRSARANQLEGERQAGRRSCAVHHHVRQPIARPIVPEDRPAGPRRPPPRAFPDACRPSARSARLREHVRAQVPEPTVTEHDHPVVRLQPKLRRNLERGGQRFGEHRDFGCNRSATLCRLRCGTET